jgi:predicted SAM-dependent methyltransferase
MEEVTRADAGCRVIVPDADGRVPPTPADPAPSLLPPPPPIDELPMRLHQLHEHPAPVFARDTRGGLRQPVKRLLNAVLRFAGRSQQAFNQDLLETVTLLMAEVRSLRRWAQDLTGSPSSGPLAPLAQEIGTLGRRVAHLQECVSTELVHAGRRRLEQLDGLETAVRDLVQRADGVAAQHAALQRELHDALGGYSAWITVLERKYQGLSLEARELSEPPHALPPPRIVDPDGYARRLAGMGDVVRVNLGCGEKPWPDYINVDLRALPGVDVLADVHALGFEPGSLAEVASSHLVEHFREHHFRTRLLPYWKSLLGPSGCMRIVCPNWAAMLQRLQDGRMSLHDFKFVTFGAQDYEGDDHFSMYTPETLRGLLLDAGFGGVEVVVTERMNGLCPEMEIVAHL